MAESTRSSGLASASSYSHTFLLIGLAAAAAAGLPGGCAAPEKEPAAVQAPEKIETPEEQYAVDGRRIAEDPVAFLREVAERTAKLEAYRLKFYRQERGGLPPSLGPMEEIDAVFRQEPFSVKFEWADDDMPYYESVYVHGENNGQLIVRERKGALPFVPPTTRRMDVMFPVKIGKSKNPITDFGLERLMERTLLPFEDPQIAETMTVEYQGIVNLEPIDRPAHHIRIDRPKTPGLAYTRQDLYFDAETLLPAGTDLYLPGNVLDARYRYADVDPDVDPQDDDFRLSTGAGSRPA